jgi:hypothetical protein
MEEAASEMKRKCCEELQQLVEDADRFVSYRVVVCTYWINKRCMLIQGEKPKIEVHH